ncbi:MAG TPA: NAD(P)H-dependent oxidoreductase [Candidatus Sulfotelmatobacter sp.]|nr:NAD(P)H-dependent oxidoreductase [Candidatus Sulfotelmatobacter sp.]
MTKLLHIDSSILGSHSKSRQLTAAIVAKLKQAQPQIEIAYRDLVATPPPHMTLASLPGDHPSSTFAGPLDDIAQHVREESQRILDEFMAAEIVVLGAPMYNWSIPTQLKAWMDIIVVPGKTFRYGPQGPEEGWVGNKRVIVAITRGVFYACRTPEIPAEHAETYMRTVLCFLGVHNPEFVIAEGVSTGEENEARALALALDAVQQLAA